MRVLRIQILLIYLKYIKIIQIYQIGFQVKTNIQKNSKTWKKEKKVFFEQRALKNELMEIILIIDVNMGKYFKYSIN